MAQQNPAGGLMQHGGSWPVGRREGPWMLLLHTAQGILNGSSHHLRLRHLSSEPLRYDVYDVGYSLNPNCVVMIGGHTLGTCSVSPTIMGTVHRTRAGVRTRSSVQQGCVHTRCAFSGLKCMSTTAHYHGFTSQELLERYKILDCDKKNKYWHSYNQGQL